MREIQFKMGSSEYNVKAMGRDYGDNVSDDEVTLMIWDHGQGRYLYDDPETGKREKGHVWVAAYTMLEGH
jgi:hypothetical protein